MMKKPVSMQLAHLPTPIMRLDRSSAELDGVELYIKRDDFTGSEVSGNKIRKLEYVIPAALNAGARLLITCGGVQSNHCRTTAAVGARLGMKVHLVLKGTPEPDGNFLMDQLFGAHMTFIDGEDYRLNRNEIMADIAKTFEAAGTIPYIIPEGASDGLGMWGYYSAMKEILLQEEAMGIRFDAICSATGSGGTYAGLYFANQVLQAGKEIVGFNVYSPGMNFEKKIQGIIEDGLHRAESKGSIDTGDIMVIDQSVGGGYGVSQPHEIEFIKNFAHKEGILLDPVYTGKAMQCMISMLKDGTLPLKGKVLFIHTGGLMGLFPKRDRFE